MKERKILQAYPGKATTDGAGVHMRRLHWRPDTFNMDPFLLLDMFDSTNPEDYIKGFPLHPHRGIETLTYLIEGEILHKDSLGNIGTIRSGQYQWMAAGSGILHEEMPQISPRMLGFQLWINLAKAEKMATPIYLDMKSEDLPLVITDGAQIRVIAGAYDGIKQTKSPHHHPVTILDINMEPNKTVTIHVQEDENAFLVPLVGQVTVAESLIEGKIGITLGDGDQISIHSNNAPVRVMFFAGKPLKEPIAWGGPIVMNTQEELDTAWEELRNGTFIKQNHLVEL
ncbi:MAG: pirin family protein [Desulfuromonadales bacterium]|nr:pirin family protein [Desulfuromonadales bacterium]